MGYQETLKIDVKNINKHIKTTCRPIYEVIDATFFEETDIFPQAFSDWCKMNPNKPLFIPSDIKTFLEIMEKEKGLYWQVVVMHQKNLDNKKE